MKTTMHLELITRVKDLVGYKVSSTDACNIRALKHATARRAFSEIVKLNGIDSQELFDRIQECFEAHSLKRPYHDWYHTCCVVENTARGLHHLLNCSPPNFSEANQKEINSTILAAAFHDVGHSGLTVPDIVNVSRSIMIAHRFLTDAHIQDRGIRPAAVDISFLMEVLQSTQYPFREPRDEYQAILRDADLLQILEPTWFEDLYVNMYQEFLEGNPALDFRQFCLDELKFIKGTKFYSQWFHGEKSEAFLNSALHRVEAAYSAARNCMIQ